MTISDTLSLMASQSQTDRTDLATAPQNGPFASFKNQALRLDAELTYRFAAWLTDTSLWLDAHMHNMEHMLDDMALVPIAVPNAAEGAAQQYVPKHSEGPYRYAVCPHTTCYKVFTSSTALVNHCRDAHGAPLYYSKLYRDDPNGPQREHPDDFAPLLINFTGHMCSLQVVVGMLSTFFDNYATYPSQGTGSVAIPRTDKFVTQYADPLEGVLSAASLQTSIDLAKHLEALGQGWSSDKPHGILSTINLLSGAFAALTQFSSFVTTTCTACSLRDQSTQHVLTLKLKSLSALANYPIGAPIATKTPCACGKGALAKQYGLTHASGETSPGIIIHCAAGLNDITTGQISIGESSHGLLYEVAAVVTVTDDHATLYVAEPDSVTGWTTTDSNLSIVDGVPRPQSVRFALLVQYDPDEAAADDDDDGAAAEDDAFGFNGADDAVVGTDPLLPVGGVPDPVHTPTAPAPQPPKLPQFVVHNVHSLSKRVSDLADAMGSDAVFLSEIWHPDSAATKILCRRPHVMYRRDSDRAGGCALVLSQDSSIVRASTGTIGGVEFAAALAQVPWCNRPVALAAIYAPPAPTVSNAFRMTLEGIAQAIGATGLDAIGGDFNARHTSWDSQPPSGSSSWGRGAHLHAATSGAYVAHAAPTLRASKSAIDILFIAHEFMSGRRALVETRRSTSDHDALVVSLHTLDYRPPRVEHRVTSTKWSAVSDAHARHFVFLVEKWSQGPRFANPSKEARRLEQILTSSASHALPQSKPFRPSAPSSRPAASMIARSNPWKAVATLRNGHHGCDLDADVVAAAFASPHQSNPALDDALLARYAEPGSPAMPPITVDEIKFAMKQLRQTASSDAAHVHPRMLRLAADSPAFSQRATALIVATLQGSWPRAWSQAIVIPVRKSSKPANTPAGWRPISILPWLLRLAEKSIKRLLMNHVTLSPLANGFRRGLATDFVTAALAAVNSLPRKTHWALIAFDFSSAFPSMPHDLVVSALEEENVPHYVIAWVVRYLHDRSIQVRTGRGTSAAVHLTCGQAQGGLLGPLLWCIMSKGCLQRLGKICDERRRTLLLSQAAGYADDTSAALAGGKDAVISAVAKVVNTVNDWASASRLLVSEKTKLVANFDWPMTRPIVCAGRNIAENCAQADHDDNFASVLGLRVSARRGSKMLLSGHVDDAIDKHRAEVALLCALKHSVSTQFLRAAYSAFCLPQLARHLPAIATSPGSMTKLDSAHAAGIKQLFDLHENTRNATAVLEAGFPTIAELQESRSAATAMTMRHRQDLAIANAAKTTGEAHCPCDLPPTRFTDPDVHFDPPGGDQLFAEETVPAVHFALPPPDTDHALSERVEHNVKAFARTSGCDYVICTDGSRCEPSDGTGAGAAAILLRRDVRGQLRPVQQWTAGNMADCSMFTCEGTALTSGILELAFDIPDRHAVTILTDSLSYAQAAAAGPQAATNFITADFWCVARIFERKRCPLTVRFVFSHVSTCANTPRHLHDAVAALDLVDSLAKRAAETRQAHVFGRFDDTLRALKRRIRTRHRQAAAGRSLRGRAGVDPKSFWRNTPRLSREKTRLILRARCGLCADVAPALHGGPPAACHLCQAAFAAGHDHAIEHIFSCPGLQQLRSSTGASSPAALWTDPIAAATVLAAYRRPTTDTTE